MRTPLLCTLAVSIFLFTAMHSGRAAIAPENDHFTNAFRINGITNNVLVDTEGATVEPGEPGLGDYSVWWTWTAPHGGKATFWIIDGSALAQIFAGATLTQLKFVTEPGGYFWGATFEAVGGQEYKLRLVNFEPGMASGRFVLWLDERPANDAFTKSIRLSGTNVVLSGTTKNATLEPGEPAPAGQNNSVWWSWRAPADGRLEIVEVSGASSIALYTGTSVSNLVALGGDGSPVHVTAGTEYHIAARTPNWDSGVVSARLQFAPKPANDDFASAIPLVGYSDVIEGTTVGATSEAGEPIEWYHSKNSVWYSFTPAVPGRLSLHQVWNLNVSVYTNNSLPTLQPSPWNDGYDVAANQTHYIRIASSPEFSQFQLEWMFTPAVLAPSNDSFSVRATLTEFRTSTGSLAHSTYEADEPGASTWRGGSVWWSWIPTSNCMARIALNGSGEPSLRIFKGTTVTRLTEIATPWDPHTPLQAEFEAQAGTEYSFQVSWYQPISNQISLRLETIGAAPNDHFANRVALPPEAGWRQWNTYWAGVEPGEPDYDAVLGGRTVWFTWTPTNAGPVTLWCGLEFEVYSGSDLSNLHLLTRSHYGISLPHSASWTAIAGKEYVIRASTRWDEPRRFELRLERESPPVVNWLSHGTNELVISPGETITFAVSATDEDDAVDRVQFQADLGAATLATHSGPPYEFTWTNFTIGSHWIHAIAYDTSGNAGQAYPIHLRVPPVNDHFSNRVALASSVLISTGALSGASSEPGEPLPTTPYGGSIWYSWVAPSNGFFTVSVALITGEIQGYPYAVFAGDDLTNLVAIVNMTSSSSFLAQAGTSYAIAVNGFGPYQPLVLTVNKAPPADNFEDRFWLTGRSNRLTLDVSKTSLQVGEPSAPHLFAYPATAWLSWQAPSDGVAAIRLLGADPYADVFVYQGSGLTTLTQCQTHGSPVRLLRVRANETYELCVAHRMRWPELTIDLQLYSAPTNDAFADSAVLLGASNSVSGKLTGATFEPGDPFATDLLNGIAGSIWWSWTAPRSGDVRVEASAGYAPVSLAVFAGESISNLTPVSQLIQASVGHAALLGFTAVEGEVYRIALVGYDSGASTNSSDEFTMTIVSAAAPVNDDWPGLPLSGYPTNVTGTTLSASLQESEPSLNSSTRTVWWAWTAPETRHVIIQPDSLSYGYFGRMISVYSNSVATDAVVVHGLFSSSGSPGFRTEAGVTYYIQVGDSEARAEPVRFGIQPNDPPLISLVSPALSGAALLPGVHDVRVDASDPDGSIQYVTIRVSPVLDPTHPVWLPNERYFIFNHAPFAFTMNGLPGAYALHVEAVDNHSVSSSLLVPFRITRSNDDFASATGMAGRAWAVSSDNTAAVAQAGEPLHGPGATNSLWWRWTAPTSGRVTLSADGSGIRAVAAVYTGATVSNLTRIASTTEGASSYFRRDTFQSVAGETYHFAVAGIDGAQGGVNLSVAMAPHYDDFGSAAPVAGAPLSFSASSAGTTREAGEPYHAFVQGAASVWWRWTPVQSGEVVVTTSSSSFDTALAVYTGTSISNLVVVGSDDDSEKNRTRICRFQAIAGQAYYIAVDGHAGAAGPFTLTIAQSGAPSLIPGGVANGALSLSLFSDGAPQVELQRSTNLLNWESVRTISSPERLLRIAEPASATSPHMFYRVVQP